MLVVPASYHRLADEAGHDDQAGLGLGHHDRAVHDVEASAQASSQHSCMWPAVTRYATDVKHKEGGQQAHDEQLQLRSGRREGRTQHDRAHEPAPTAATGGASGIASARILSIDQSIYLSIYLSIYSARYTAIFGLNITQQLSIKPYRGTGYIQGAKEHNGEFSSKYTGLAGNSSGAPVVRRTCGG